MAITLADLVVMIGANRDRLDRDLDRTERDTRNWAQRAGSGITTALGGAVVAGAATAGAAIVGLGVTSFNMATDVDSAMNAMSNRISDFEVHAEKLEGAMLDVFGGNYADSVEDAAQSIETVFNAAGFAARRLSQDELAEVTKQALAIRDVFNVDVSESVRVATNMVNNGLVPSFEDAFNTIINGYQTGANAQGDWLDTLNEYSDDFADLGVTADQALAMINAGLAGGAFNTDKLADAINEFGVQMRDPAIQDAIGDIDAGLLSIYEQFQTGQITEGEALAQMLTGLNDIDDAVRRDQAGVLLFRSMWEDMGETAILSMGRWEDFYQSSGDAADELTNRQRTLGERWQAIWRNIQVTALLPIGETIVDIAESAMPTLERGAAWLAERLPGWVEIAGNAFGRFRDYLVNVVWPAVQPFFQWLTDVALPAYIDYLTNVFFPTMQRVFNWLINTALPVIVAFVQNRVIPAMRDIANFVQNRLWPAIQPVLEWLVNTALPAAINFIQNTLVPGVRDAINTIRDVIDGIVKFIETYVMPVINTAFGIISEGWQALLAAFRGDWVRFGTHLRNAFDKLVNSIRRLLSNVVTYLGNTMRRAWDAIRNIDWASLGRGIINGIVNGIIQARRNAVKAMQQVALSMLQSARGFFRIGSPSKLFADEVGTPIAEGIAQGIADATGDISTSLNTSVQVPGAKTATQAGKTVGAGVAGLMSGGPNITMSFGNISVGEGVTVEQVMEAVYQGGMALLRDYDDARRKAYT